MSRMLPIAQLLPALPGFTAAKTYATWPVWSKSTTAESKFAPMPKKEAVRLFHRARQFERQTRQPGRQDGALGRNGLAVLHALIFDFLNYTTGRLDPGYAAIAHKAAISIRSVARGLAALKRAGVLNWVRRCFETRDDKGRFRLAQDTNAYAVLPPSQWHSFDNPEPPAPDPATWGADRAPSGLLDQATIELQHGARRTALAILDADPNDALAAALARLGRAVDATVDGGECRHELSECQHGIETRT
jgi:hypothetical protein